MHIAAPSTSRDDALYRTLASAYLAFDPVRRIDLPAQEARTVEPGLPPAELFSPQASFNNVWDNIRPPQAQTSAHKANSQNEESSQTSWVQPPSEIADSMPDHNLSIPEFNSPGRILDLYLQTQGPALEPSQDQEAGRRDLSEYEGGNDLTSLFARGTDSIIQGGNRISTAPGEKPAASQHSVYEGGADFSTLLAQATDTIIHDYPARDPNPTQNTIYEGSFDFNALLGRGTNSILQGDRIPPTPAAAPAAAPAPAPAPEPSTSAARYGTPPNATTSGSRMDESHVSQTPSSPLRSKGILPPPSSSSVRSSKLIRPRSSDPTPTNQQSQSDLFGVTIPATQLPDRADSEPPSSKRQKPNPVRKRIHDLGRATSDVLPRGTASRASPAPRHTTLPPPRAAAATQSTDWSSHTHLNTRDPAPSTRRLGPRVPLKLATLMEEIGDRYQPTYPRTAGGSSSSSSSSSPPTMRAYERGYWLLPLADWPHSDKLSAWGFLGNYICRDRAAGWGTRACRDEGWAWIRLYGWEHIAGELYALLYMASFRRLKAMEIAWYDGKGDVWIVVRARGEKSAVEWGRVWCEIQA